MESIVTPENIKKVVDNLKSNGTFDRVRRECLSDVDTKVRGIAQLCQCFVTKAVFSLAVVSKSNSTC